MKRIIIAMLLVFSTSNLHAIQLEPATLSYQGTLTDNTGIPLTGTKSLRVCLYKTPTAGTSFWCDNYSVTLKNGQFSIILGSETNKLTDQFSNFTGETYIGIKVGTDAEMPLRQRVTSVAYALNAINAVNAQNATNSTNASVATTVVSSNTDSNIPAGSIIAFGGTTAPPGWLLCDGRSLKRSDYIRLFNAIGTAHGAVLPNTTTIDTTDTYFNLPDYRGRFLRGVDYSPNPEVPLGPATGRDPDLTETGRTTMQNGGNTGATASTSIGSVQDDQFRTHHHNLAVGWWLGPWNGFIPLGGQNDTSQYAGDTNTRDSGGNETRPKNAYVNWIIKY